MPNVVPGIHPRRPGEPSDRFPRCVGRYDDRDHERAAAKPVSAALRVSALPVGRYWDKSLLRMQDARQAALAARIAAD